MTQERPMKLLDETEIHNSKQTIKNNQVFNETLSLSVLKRFYLHLLTLLCTFFLFLGEVL